MDLILARGQPVSRAGADTIVLFCLTLLSRERRSASDAGASIKASH